MTDKMTITISDKRGIKQYNISTLAKKIGLVFVIGSIVIGSSIFLTSKDDVYAKGKINTEKFQALKKNYTTLEERLTQVILEKTDLEQSFKHNQILLSKLQKEKIVQTEKIAKIILEKKQLEKEVAKNKIVLAKLYKEKETQAKALEEKVLAMKHERKKIQSEVLENRSIMAQLKKDKTAGVGFQTKLTKIREENTRLRKAFEENKSILSGMQKDKVLDAKVLEEKIARMLLLKIKNAKEKRKLLAQQEKAKIKRKKIMATKKKKEKLEKERKRKKILAEKRKKQDTKKVRRGVPRIAKKKLGRRYVWGAVGPGTFDCSGFTSYVYKKTGINIPRTSREQSKYGRYVKRKQLKAGDLIFFDTSRRRKGIINHVGIYLGDNKFIHASSAKKKVIITSLKKPFYSQRYKWARRVVN